MLDTLFHWCQAHPFLAALIAWATAMCLCLLPFLIRGWRKPSGSSEDRGPLGLPRELQLRAEDRITPQIEAIQESLRRIPMHNRFMPDGSSGPRRDLALVDQILGDQAAAHEKPGRRANALAPGERHYREPGQIIRVVVDAFTVVLQRGETPVLLEAGPDGADYPPVPVPEPWNDVLTAYAFEVNRLREGWTHPSEISLREMLARLLPVGDPTAPASKVAAFYISERELRELRRAVGL